MENNNINVNTQKLMESFMKLKRFHWTGSPVGDLKHSEIFVLFCIKKFKGSSEGGLKISEISSHMKVSNPTTTQTVNKLEEKGYVERTIDKEDRRAVRIVLTEKGEEAIITAKKSFISFFDGLVNYLGDEKSRLLSEIIDEAAIYISESKKKKS